MLPLNTEMVRLASGDIFTNRFPDHPFTHELQGVANESQSMVAKLIAIQSRIDRI